MPSDPNLPGDAGSPGGEEGGRPAQPPPLPPAGEQPSGGAGPPPIPFTAHPVFQGRLHPLTLVFALWNLVRGFIIPAVILLVLGSEKLLGVLLLVFVIFPLIMSVARYFTFSYRIEGDELVTQQGVLGRTERNIPLTRVQDIRIEQGVLHRMLGMADVHVETAGGQGSDASLSVLAKAEAERLRTAIFAQRHAAAGAEDQSTGQPEPEREVIRELTVRDLVVAGMTSNHMASALALLFVAWNLLDDLLPKDMHERWVQFLSQSTERWVNEGIQTGWLTVLLWVGALMLFGLVLSVGGSVVMFYGFKLARSGEDLHRSYGLLTRRASSLPRRRIQVLQIEEKLLRRLFGLATVRADTAGGVSANQANSGGRDVLLPIIPRRDADNLLPVFFPDWENKQAEWRRVSTKAITRGTFKGTVVCLALAGVSYGIQQEWISLWPLIFIPLVLVLNVMSYRHLGYCFGERYFRTRRGWLSRSTHVVPIRNAQAIVLRETPFDRRHRVKTLVVDTAGQAYTGGGPKIHNVAREEAVKLARALAQRAAQTRFRW